MDPYLEQILQRFLLGGGSLQRGCSHVFSPDADVFETQAAVFVVASLPGVRAEDVKVVVGEDHLVLRGLRAHPFLKSRVMYHRKEIPFGAFALELALPAKVDPAEASAELSDGFLIAKLPHKRDLGPASVTIQIRLNKEEP